MLINDKVDAVYIPDSPSRIKATDYNQIKNEIQECITLAGLTPTKDVIQLPDALKILTQQSGAEEVAKIEAAGQEQLNAINTAGAQAVQNAQDAAATATSKAAEAADSAAAASASAALAQNWAVKTGGTVSGGEYSAKYHAQQAAASASEANTAKTAAQSAKTAAESAKTQAAASATSASQSAIEAANSAASAKGLQIGSVYFSQSNLATDNPGALPLWTGEYYSNASSLYPDFYNWVKSHSELQITKEEYDNAVSLTGSCAKYVVDEVSGSLRLPKLTNYIKMADSESGLTQSKAGLPNITGTFSVAGENYTANLSGAFSEDGFSEKIAAWDGSTKRGIIKFSAEDSSSIYGASETVTPAHTTLYPWIYAFNSAVSASVAQAAEFTGALSGKAAADLSNGTKAAQMDINRIMPDAMDYVVESYSDEDGNWYRVYKSGWVEQGGDFRQRENNTVITFLKPMSPSFNLEFNNFGYNVYKLDSISQTGFEILNANNTSTDKRCCWTVKGKGAE